MFLCKISVAFLRKTVYYILLDYYRGVCPDVTTSSLYNPKRPYILCLLAKLIFTI